MTSPRDPQYVLDLGRLQFYKKYFGLLLWTLIIAIVVIGVLVAAFVVVKNQRVEREYFSVDAHGRLTSIIPLTQPYVSQSKLLSWAAECVTAANTYDFVNYQKQFQNNALCFTKEGWEQFMTAVERSGTLETVRNQRLVASAVSQGAAVVTKEGIRRGAYTWEIELPILVTYQGGQAGRTMISQKLLVTLLVSRVPTFENENGVGIAQYVGKEKS